jgi:hypothetical protein
MSRWLADNWQWLVMAVLASINAGQAVLWIARRRRAGRPPQPAPELHGGLNVLAGHDATPVFMFNRPEVTEAPPTPAGAGAREIVDRARDLLQTSGSVDWAAALGRCLEAAHVLGLHRDTEWLTAELRGWGVREAGEIDEREEPYASATYRIIRPVVRMMVEGHVREWRWPQFFLSHPVSRVAQIVESGKEAGADEATLHFPVGGLPGLADVLARAGVDAPTFPFFVPLQEFEHVVEGARARVLEFLARARRAAEPGNKAER